MKLKLRIRQLRNLQQRFGIENILQPSTEDMRKMLSLDFLVAFVDEGTAHLEKKPEIEEMELSELVGHFKSWQAGEESEGKPE